MRPDTLVKRFRAMCDEAGQGAVAEALNISRQYVSDIYLGKRPITAKIAQSMGFEKVTTFQKVRNSVDKAEAVS